MSRRASPSDMDDMVYEVLAPYLALSPEDALQSRFHLRDVFSALISWTGAQCA